MKFTLEKIPQLSGAGCTIYSTVFEGEALSSFDDFLSKYDPAHPDEMTEIIHTIQAIGETGAETTFFKLHEGTYGDGVCALYDDDRKFRLYCIRFSNTVVILGGGGIKNVRTHQEDPILTENVEKMKYASAKIREKLAELGEELYEEDDILKGKMIN